MPGHGGAEPAPPRLIEGGMTEALVAQVAAVRLQCLGIGSAPEQPPSRCNALLDTPRRATSTRLAALADMMV